MAKQDMIWTKPPQTWYESPFMGNGILGLMMYIPKDSNNIRLDIGNSLVQDHRDDSYGSMVAFTRCRLPIGYFTINPVGKIQKCHLRLRLWDAETVGLIETDNGSIKIKAYVHAVEHVIVVEYELFGGEKKAVLKWQPLKAESPRQTYGLNNNQPAKVMKDYKENPVGILSVKEGVSIYTQPLLVGGETVTAWKQKITGDKHVVLINVSHSFPSKNALDEAISTIEKISKYTSASLNKSHQNWWHSFYPKSFISLPDKKLENFYWIQLYKLASATRSNGALIDNQGPWLQATPWPAAWWNLNVQLTYWLTNSSNHPELCNSLLNSVVKNTDNLTLNVAPKYRSNAAAIGRLSGSDLLSRAGEAWEEKQKEDNTKIVDNNFSLPEPEIGLLTWTCHNLWLNYRYTMNDEMLRSQLFPILKKAINYYFYFLKKEKDGKYHLPYTYSPEYGVAKDCNFDLSLLKWGCETLLESCKRLNIKDTLFSKWKDVVNNLVDFPTDENGFRIGADQAYDKSHRHYSHLFMIYPLHLLDITKESNLNLIQKSLDYWHSKPAALQGYSFTGAASISAMIGHGDAALKYLNGLFSKFLKPNTLYAEAGPVIETPLSGGQAIVEMLLQSWGNQIRVFPALPSTWGNVVFDNLRTEGAFLISAERKNGKTVFIKIKSEAGEPCIINTDMIQPIIGGNKATQLTKIGINTYRIPLKKGQIIVLTQKNDKTNYSIQPIAAKTSNEQNYFGLK